MDSRKLQHRAFIAALDALEVPLSAQVEADLNRFFAKAATRYLEHGTLNFFDLVDKHQQEVFDTLKTHYKKIVPTFGHLALGQVKSRSFKSEQEDALFTDIANQWIHTQGLQRSKSIADTSEANVLAAIYDGIDEGLGTAEIGRDIAELTDLSPWRSELIARTEVHAAANYASVETVRNAEDKLGVSMLKAWSPTIDDRTRPAHADMEGTPAIAMDDPFIVEGEQMDRPGDPAGSPDNVIGCRCVLVYEEKQ